MNDLKPANNPPRRVGLFGGTFNPIHKGHLQVAEHVRQQFGLNRIHFIPCAQPPHKTHGILAPAKERLAMVGIAVKNQPAFQVSDIEIRRTGPSYTIDTLRRLKQIHGDRVVFHFLVGVDAFLEIHTWKSYRCLFDLAAFIVMTRPGSEKQELSLQPLVSAYTHRHISDRYTLTADGRALKHPEKHAIYPASVTPVAIASTQIRDMIRSGQPVHQWTGYGVSDYIVNKGLYR